MRKIIKANQGFSMVELMVALVLGLLVVSAVLQIFLSANRTYKMTEDMSRIQENGRFAIEYLKRDIRQAGFWGCLTDIGSIRSHLNVDPSNPNPLLEFTGTISGAEGSGYFADKLSGNIRSDAIILGGGGVDGTSPIQITREGAPNTSESTRVTPDSGLVDGQIIVITDCKTADILQITGINSSNDDFDLITHNSGTGDPGNDGDVDMTKDYHGAAISSLFTLNNSIYTVSMGAGSEPALYRNGEELVEGIESLQVLYGVAASTGGKSVDSYETFTPANAEKIVSVKISLISRGYVDNISDPGVSWSYSSGAAPSTVTALDRRLRKVFSSTIAIRNRLN